MVQLEIQSASGVIIFPMFYTLPVGRKHKTDPRSVSKEIYSRSLGEEHRIDPTSVSQGNSQYVN